jgi:hypothetical protein
VLGYDHEDTQHSRYYLDVVHKWTT